MLTPRQLFLKHQAQTTDFPLLLEIEKAEGVHMFGANGEKYLDLISGIGVSNVGHRHPHVIKAIQEQLDKYLHLMVYGEFVQSPQVKLAEALSKTLPENLSISYFVNSGSEAVEGAMKLAKRFTGRTEIIACHNAYHGSTHGSLSLNGSENFKRAYRPLLPDINHIQFNSFEELEKITSRTAAIILETVQGEAGVRVPENGYLKAVRERCNQTGTLLILDEIQSGFGRTGTFWAFEQFDVIPDILTCAKGMGGGMPIGAFITSEAIMSTLKNNPILGHITTFGGHPVSCAASLATLEVIQRENLLAGVAAKAALFKAKLQHPAIKNIRNCGLMMAAEMESFDILKPVIDQAILDGVLTDWFLFCDNSMRIAPPLTITETEIEDACAIILNAINKIMA
ncbi:aspartate aminotransferase family protein [Adhaeribacter terreus]|uniref:Aspartate aminotransferase family protein n=1 Tax=Adhaeribacter terreus TaxID=529703 RepID=A0ABW0EEG6_9BACT